MDRILSTDEVLKLIQEAIALKKPLSLSRFGHGEIAYATWPRNKKWRKGFEYYRNYAGAASSIEELNKALIDSLFNSDIVGIHVIKDDSQYEVRADEPCAEITKKLLKRLDFTPKYVCSAWVTHHMIDHTAFWELLRQNNIALVGRRAKEATPYFQRLGVNIVDSIPLEGLDQIDEVCEKLSNNDMWDITLLAAGIPATILSPLLSKKSNRVVIDFGHALDRLIEGNSFSDERLTKEWLNTSFRQSEE
ncbi:GT-D fold domain-containing glycosyltransferase [Metabacillus fastidiosus]|uniref:GT-D fold domain-containing protein n=1 Tax=Metabacillus fastidiosus TaxID=1458 RepID=UPI003D2A6FC4